MIFVSGIEEQHNQIVIWNVEKDTVIHKIENREQHCIKSITFASGCKRLATSSCSGDASLWDMETGALLHELTAYGMFTCGDMIIVPGDHYLIAAQDKQVCLWDLNAGLNKPVCEIGRETVKSLQLSADGLRLVITGHDGLVETWDMQGNLLYTLNGGRFECCSTRHLCDVQCKKFFKTSKDYKVNVWDIATQALLHVLHGHTGNIEILELSNDGTHLVTGANGYDKTVRIWSLQKSSARKWLETQLFPFQANFIARAYATQKGNNQFLIYQNTDDMMIWTSLPSAVRAYLRLYLPICVMPVLEQMYQQFVVHDHSDSHW